MALNRRYTPEWPESDQGLIGMSFENVIPPGTAILANATDTGLPTAQPCPRLEIWTNVAAPIFVGGWDVTQTALASGPDWFIDANLGGTNGTGVMVRGRTVVAMVEGGQPGSDYLFKWVVIDGFGNRHTRTGLLLVAPTS